MGALKVGPPKIQRRSLWQHIEKRDREMRDLVQVIQVQNAALKLLLDGFRDVPFTKKCRSRWVGADEIASLRKLLPMDANAAKAKAKKRPAPQVSQQPAVA
jgi:hypothetical protein